MNITFSKSFQMRTILIFSLKFIWRIGFLFVVEDIVAVEHSNHDRRRSENGDLSTSMLNVPLRYPLLNPLSRWEGSSLSLVATLGFKMGIRGEKPQDPRGAF
jgi:hypothetical protein